MNALTTENVTSYFLRFAAIFYLANFSVIPLSLILSRIISKLLDGMEDVSRVQQDFKYFHNFYFNKNMVFGCHNFSRYHVLLTEAHFALRNSS